jgi:pyrroline-5-carboxylate reductase
MESDFSGIGGSRSRESVAVLGGGKMGTLIANALIKRGGYAAENVIITVKHEKSLARVAQATSASVMTNNIEATSKAGVVLLCVKPQQAISLLEEIRPALKPGAIVISIITALPLEAIEECLGDGIRVVRAMPNTACRVAMGMTALCRGSYADDDCVGSVASMFELMGRTVEIDEQWMDSVTALSASSPAFIYIILEALAEGGVRVGLPRELATLLAGQATLGAAAMLLDGSQHPALLKSEVTTPGGCTIDGILELEEGGIRATLIRAISTTADKARKMSTTSTPLHKPASSSSRAPRP